MVVYVIPSWWQFTLVALGAYRLTRLLGWDDWPPIYKTRAWLLGEKWFYPSQTNAHPPRVAYDRPLTAKLFHCPFCLGWWVCLTCWGTWLLFPRFAVVALTPWALSGVVGLVAKNLDP